MIDSIQIYGIDNLVNDIRTNLGFAPNWYFRIAWKYLCPIIVTVLMILSLTYSDELKYGDYTYPWWSIVFGWCLNIGFILPIPLTIIYTFFRYSNSRISFFERIRFLFMSNIEKRKIKQQIENGTGLHLSPSSPISNV